MDITQLQYTGQLKVSVISTVAYIPIEGATVTITAAEAPEEIMLRLNTNSSGEAEIVTLDTPPLAYSEEFQEERKPYAEYNVLVEADDYEPVLVTGVEILPEQLALLRVRMTPREMTNEQERLIPIPPHTLYYEYPPKIPEAEIKPMAESGEIVLSRVVIPEYIIVHDGVPSDASAPNYWVRYKDYIKNVASCEIYSTWPEATIYANILVIMSFTLNRVYTEWYRNQQ